MKPFKVLSHTADLRLRVFGRTDEELFQNGAMAIASILYQKKLPKSPASYEKIEISARNLEELLVDFLSEVLTRAQINKKIYNRVKFLKFSPTNLKAQIFGKEIDRFDKDIKAVTHHEVSIQKNKRGIFETTLVLDI